MRDIASVNAFSPQSQLDANGMPLVTRLFEVTLLSGLVFRFQAEDANGCAEWIRSLRALSYYWKQRVSEDGQSARELSHRSSTSLEDSGNLNIHDSPMFNVCGISACRSITMRGVIFRKSRKSGIFKRVFVIICQGSLLTFRFATRDRKGCIVPSLNHEKTSTLALSECYVYSGAATKEDLLYQSSSIDNHEPGSVALPRVYADGRQSTDEETATTFVLWHGRRMSVLAEGSDRKSTGSRLRRVSRLGVVGKSLVFKARSAQERDMWVSSLTLEINRVSEDDPSIRLQGHHT